MPNRLVQMLSVTEVAPGATVPITIGLANANVALIPDTVERDNFVFEIVSCRGVELSPNSRWNVCQ
jgi:hypothetical protein